MTSIKKAISFGLLFSCMLNASAQMVCDSPNLYHPKEIEEIPRGLVQKLDSKSCMLPNTKGVVAEGSFKQAGIKDTVVFCVLPDSQLRVFLFGASDPSRVELVADWGNGKRIEMFPSGSDGCEYSVFLYSATREHILEDWWLGDGDDWPKKEDIVTDGINIGCCEKSPFTTYWNRQNQSWDEFYNSGC